MYTPGAFNVLLLRYLLVGFLVCWPFKGRDSSSTSLVLLELGLRNFKARCYEDLLSQGWECLLWGDPLAPLCL